MNCLQFCEIHSMPTVHEVFYILCHINLCCKQFYRQCNRPDLIEKTLYFSLRYKYTTMINVAFFPPLLRLLYALSSLFCKKPIRTTRASVCLLLRVTHDSLLVYVGVWCKYARLCNIIATHTSMYHCKTIPAYCSPAIYGHVNYMTLYIFIELLWLSNSCIHIASL